MAQPPDQPAGSVHQARPQHVTRHGSEQEADRSEEEEQPCELSEVGSPHGRAPTARAIVAAAVVGASAALIAAPVPAQVNTQAPPM